MILGFEFRTAAKSKRDLGDEQPSQQPMRAGIKPAQQKAPSTDQKKVRRQMAKNASVGDFPSCPSCGADNATPFADGTYQGLAFCGSCGAVLDLQGQQVQPAGTFPVTATRTASKENLVSREADILRAMASSQTTLPEQRRLAAELESIRAQRTASVHEAREIDLADTVVRDTLTPVRVHERHTAATDWINEIPTSGGNYDHEMRTQATVWFNRLHEAVKADREEFGEQAKGMARREAGRFGEYAAEAAQTFMDTAARLHRMASEQNGNAESTVTDYDTKTDQDPLYAEDWEGADEVYAVHPPMPGAGETVMSARWRTAAEYQGGSPKQGDTATCHADGKPIEFFAGEWMHLKGSGASNHNDVYPGKKSESARIASEGNTCSVCGDKIAKDPSGEDNSTWHHDNGEKHDHEAKPGGSTEASRKVAERECKSCGGTGRISQGPGMDLGPGFPEFFDCPTCKGTGKTAARVAVSDAQGASLRAGDVVKVDGREGTVEEINGSYAKVVFEDGTSREVSGGSDLEKVATRKTSVSLTNVGIEGDYGVGTDPSGNRVKFNLSEKDKADLKAVLYSDLAVNFSGVDVAESDIVKDASLRTAAASTYEVKKVHSDTWLPGGESTEEAGEVIKANVTGSEEEFWLLRNNFNGAVNVYAYHGAMKGIDSSMPPRNMGTYEQFYGSPYREASLRKSAARLISEIADEIAGDWTTPNYAAAPYLDAMRYLGDMNSKFYEDDAADVVIRFLGNARSWRGEVAERVKAELRDMLASNRRGASKTAGTETINGNTFDTGECRTCGRAILGVNGTWRHDPRDKGPVHPDGSVAGDAHGVVPKEGTRKTADAYQEAVRKGMMMGTSEFINPGAMLPSSVYVVMEPGPNGARPTDQKTTSRDVANAWAEELLARTDWSPYSRTANAWGQNARHLLASDQDGNAESSLPNVEVGSATDVMWPVELADGDPVTGEGAAKAGTPTPGGESGYPQPTASRTASVIPAQGRTADFRARVQAGLARMSDNQR